MHSAVLTQCGKQTSATPTHPITRGQLGVSQRSLLTHFRVLQDSHVNLVIMFQELEV